MIDNGEGDDVPTVDMVAFLTHKRSKVDSVFAAADRPSDAQRTGQDNRRHPGPSLRGTPYVPSPLLYGDSLYFLTHYQGIITRVNARTGEDQPGTIRLGSLENIYASPVAGGRRVYVSDLDGKTIVLSHEDKPRVLALNRLDDVFAASAAIVGREIFLRGERHLNCIADEAKSARD